MTAKPKAFLSEYDRHRRKQVRKDRETAAFRLRLVGEFERWIVLMETQNRDFGGSSVNGLVGWLTGAAELKNHPDLHARLQRILYPGLDSEDKA